MKRRLSSSGTFFWRLFPVVWVSPFVIGAIQISREWLMLPSGANSPLADLNPLILPFAILGGAFAFWMLGGLKSVYLKDDCLLVSNYLKEIEIPLSNVERISKPENSSHRRIAIFLRAPSEFGRKIVFMPPFFMAREISDELKNAVGVCQESKKSTASGSFEGRHNKGMQRTRN